MPSSDESVTLQTDFSFKHSLAPAICSVSKHNSWSSRYNNHCYGNECETTQATTGLTVKKELKENLNLVSVRELNYELSLLL